MKLAIRLGGKNELIWAQETVTKYHYLKSPVDPRARLMVYIIEYAGQPLGLVMAGIPHATRCGGWFGYPGLPTQWQVLDLCRIWLNPKVQAGGELALSPGIVPGFIDRRRIFRPTVASWAIGQILKRIQRDRVSLWPPVFLAQPYHIRLVISYHDPQYHRGIIYRETKAEPMYIKDGRAIPGPSGKYGWCWRLPEPEWSWDQIEIARPRNLRLPL